MTYNRAVRSALSVLLLWALIGLDPGSVRGAEPRNELRQFRLEIDRFWRLDLPDLEPFNASGLVRRPDGSLLVVSDRGPEVFQVRFQDGTDSARLLMLTNCFTDVQMKRFERRKPHRLRYDAEGIALDERGRLYLVEESDRWILRHDPARDLVERLVIDWTPVRRYFHPRNANASFEGIAVGGGRLYVANERSRPRIIVVDLARVEVVEDFEVSPLRRGWFDLHYSDLSWHRGVLYVLLREARCVLAVDPGTREVMAEFDYRELESAPAHEYERDYGFLGVMEGLAVDDEFFWLVTDNNHRPRKQDTTDRRPTLFRCRRPDRRAGQG